MPSIELLITGFLTIILVASLIAIRSKLPYTIVLVFIGIALVLLSNSYFLGYGIIGSTLSSIRSYTLSLGTSGGGGLFVGLVVPPLIFEAMIHIKSGDLKSVLRPSFALATIGVLIATVVVGLLLWWIVGLPIYISFLFAAVISPTDSATVLEIFRRIKVPSKLATLLETEAAFNDATGILIFTIVLASITVSQLPLFNAVGTFILLFGGGVAVGLGVAFVGELLASLVSDRLTETILTISVVYGSYVAASGLGFSGLVAVSVVGLYFGNYTIKTAIRPSNREAIRVFWEIAAFIGNSVAFLFIGLRTDLLKLSQSLELVVVAYLAVLAARAATVYPILTVFDKVSKGVGEKIPLKWRNVAMLGGMKGALSIALSASIASSAAISATDALTVSDLVLGVAFTSIIVQGALLSTYAKRRFPVPERAKDEIAVRFASTASDIEALQKLKSEGKVSDAEFGSELERYRDALSDILSELETSIGPSDIVKAHASRLYDSISSSRPSNLKTKNAVNGVSEDQKKDLSKDQEKSKEQDQE
ncbi:MAG: cation:proton antiporter [Nitrososphaerales archaeon]